MLDPGTGSGFRDAGQGAEPEMGARGEVSLVIESSERSKGGCKRRQPQRENKVQ